MDVFDESKHFLFHFLTIIFCLNLERIIALDTCDDPIAIQLVLLPGCLLAILLKQF